MADRGSLTTGASSPMADRGRGSPAAGVSSGSDDDNPLLTPPSPPPPPPLSSSPPPQPPSEELSRHDSQSFCYPGPSLLERALRKRRTWVALFVLAYAALIYSSWNILVAIRAWYAAATAAAAESGSGWWLAAAYASAMYGLVFGVLSMAAALAVAVPATLVTWITLLVLLAFAGKPRRRLVDDGRKITADIAGVVVKVVVTEGRAVAVACAVACFFALRGRRQGEDDRE